MLLLLLLVPVSPGVDWLVAGLSVTMKFLPSYELHLHFVTHLILSKEWNSCFPEQMFTSISQNLFVPHSSHGSRKFSGRLQLSRSFYQYKLNLGVFIFNSYSWSYLILPPSYSVPGVKTWVFVAKGALKKKKQCCKSCRSVDHFFYFLFFLQFYCTWSSQSGNKLCKIPDFVLAKKTSWRTWTLPGQRCRRWSWVAPRGSGY